MLMSTPPTTTSRHRKQRRRADSEDTSIPTSRAALASTAWRGPRAHARARQCNVDGDADQPRTDREQGRDVLTAKVEPRTTTGMER